MADTGETRDDIRIPGTQTFLYDYVTVRKQFHLRQWCVLKGLTIVHVCSVVRVDCIV